MSLSCHTSVVFYWHMHQPDYRDAITNEYYFPWTYLHGLKDYVDMVAHLEAVPEAKAVFNFSPVLLEQLDDYARNLRAWQKEGSPVRDEVLAALVAGQLPEPGSEAFFTLAKKCLRANRQRIIERFAPYTWLADQVDSLAEDDLLCRYLSEQFLADLLVWYHLGWMAESVRRENPLVQALQEKAGGFSLDERRALAMLIADLLEGIIPRYKALLESGQAELTINPWSHPILPLLQTFNSAREAMPEVTLPSREYIGGWERTLWQLDKGLEIFEYFFGTRPTGCWPSEGALSEQTLTALRRKGFLWTASGDSVLRNSMSSGENIEQLPDIIDDPNFIYHAWQFAGIPVDCFFRDDAISDAIGFQYSQWQSADAVNDLINRLETIARSNEGGEPLLIPIIMDGENAWEFYAENAYDFLSEIYQRLSQHELLHLTTFSEWLARSPARRELSRLVAGSWVYGTFSTWIGDPDKNRAWSLLVEAKEQFDLLAARREEFSADEWLRIEEQLARCESSDWFWWYGDYNPAETVRDFDYLYRRHLLALYRLMRLEPPARLQESLGAGHGHPETGGVMRKGHHSGDQA